MNKIHIISKTDNNYPKNLLTIENPPDIFFAIGNLSLLNTFSLAIVGSRNYTLDAKTLTSNLVKDLVKHKVTIVSGMARGIDSIAHDVCIEEKGYTIAITSGGFFKLCHQKIFNQIIKNNGLIISEYFPDTPSYKSNFAQRNRLISGISNGVIIPQAGLNSGTLITANYALKQKKLLFSFPWNIDNQNYFGNNLLLTQGAKCILSYKDILKYYPNFNETDFKDTQTVYIPDEFKTIYSKLKNTPVLVNQLSSELDMPLSELQYKLTLMELEELIKKLPNNYIIRK